MNLLAKFDEWIQDTDVQRSVSPQDYQRYLEVKQVWTLVSAYYDDNYDLVCWDYPETLFVAHLRSAIPSLLGVDPEQAWAAAEPLLRHIGQIAKLAYARMCEEQRAYEEWQWAEQRRQAEQQEREARAAEAAEELDAIRTEVERFYDQHTLLLQGTFPPALFRVCLYAAVHRRADPAQAWAAAQELLAQLHEIVVREETRQRQAEESARRTRAELDALQQRIAALAGRDDEASREYLLILQRQADRLQGPSTRNTISTDDL